MHRMLLKYRKSRETGMMVSYRFTTGNDPLTSFAQHKDAWNLRIFMDSNKATLVTSRIKKGYPLKFRRPANGQHRTVRKGRVSRDTQVVRPRPKNILVAGLLRSQVRDLKRGLHSQRDLSS
jgi:hypothetical protein